MIKRPPRGINRFSVFCFDFRKLMEESRARVVVLDVFGSSES